VDGNHVTLEAPNEFSEVWLKDNYTSLLQDAFAIAAGRQLQVKFQIATGGAPVALAPVTAPVKAKSAESGHERATGGEIHFNPKNTFDTFVVGNNNNFSYAAALAVAQAPFTAALVWARHICFTPSASTSLAARRARASLISRPKNSPTNTLTASRTTSSPGSARNTARPTCC
jgi:hypothetical protein